MQVHKWDFIKRKRDEMQTEMAKLLQRARRLQTLTSHAKTCNLLAYIWAVFEGKREERKQKLRTYMTAVVSYSKFKKSLRKKGNNLKERQRR
jgi:uncharacterized protein with ParB-like and HNH nuclease domain